MSVARIYESRGPLTTQAPKKQTQISASYISVFKLCPSNADSLCGFTGCKNSAKRVTHILITPPARLCRSLNKLRAVCTNSYMLQLQLSFTASQELLSQKLHASSTYYCKFGIFFRSFPQHLRLDIVGRAQFPDCVLAFGKCAFAGCFLGWTVKRVD